MWLIEWDGGQFVNAERIIRLDMSVNGVVWFWLEDDSGGHRVAPEFTELFVNNLQALNNNIQSIQSRYYELKEEKQND